MEFSGRREVVKALEARKAQSEYNEEFGLEIVVDYQDAAAQPSSKTDITSIINAIYMSGSGRL